MSLLKDQVATSISKGDFSGYLGISYQKKEEESNLDSFIKVEIAGKTK